MVGSLLVSDSSECNEILNSPNFGDRVPDAFIKYIVLHYTGMPDSAVALKRLCDTESNVSCHYFITETGQIIQLVGEQYRAWHAGQSYWHGLTDLNSYSVGIEIANPGHEFGYVPFADAQIEAAIKLCSDICSRQNITPTGILAHSDIAPERKLDPGELFPWNKLFAAGVGLWVEPEVISSRSEEPNFNLGPEKQELISSLQQYGFNCLKVAADDEQLKKYIAAFQRRFRPERVDGIADRSTIKTLQKFLALSSDE